MKRVISLFLTLMLIVGLCPVISVNAEWDGTASASLTQENGVYLISSAADLKKANELIVANANNEASASFKLTDDIDFENNLWTPISFWGTFDGNKHVIRNVKISPTQSGQLVAFFGDTTGSTNISNLGLENVNVELTVQAAYAGIFLGRSGGNFTNCYVSNSRISSTVGEWCMGGFAGEACRSAVFTNCYIYNTTMVPTCTTAGAFIGQIDNTDRRFTNCYAAGVKIENASHYGFGQTKGYTVFATNCYTSIAATAAGAVVSATVADKDTMVEKLSSAYASSDDVNDGYPCFAWQLWDGTASASLVGEGTATSPYLISSPADLKKANELIVANANGEAGATFKLTSNIDYANTEWTPMSFGGTFDGAGYYVKNVKISNNNGANAFFGDVAQGAVIKNFGLENMNIILNSANNTNVMYTAAFVFRNGGRIENCYVKNSVVNSNTGGWRAWSLGGFSGSAWKSAVFENCYVYNTEVNGSSGVVGGFTGKLDGPATFKNCYVAETTSNCATYDGFGHTTTQTATLDNCYTTMATTEDVTDSMGATFGTKDSIILAMVTSGKTNAYRKSDLFNDGYPSLTWERWKAATTLSGAGTEASPYLIGTGPELQLASKMVNEDTAMTGAARAHYKLVANIDYENGEWIPIACNNSFYGVFDGDNHTVKNLKITDSSLFAFGFFGTTEQTAVVKNLGIENFTIDVYIPAGTSSQENYGHRIGGMVAAGSGTFKNCFVKNSSLRNTNVRWYANEYGVGGFVGWLRRMSNISDCYVYNVKLCSYGNTGGFAGWVDTSTGTKVTNCYAASISRDTTGASGDLGAGNSATRSFMMTDTKTDVIVTNCYSDFNAAAEDDVLEKVYDKSEIIEGIVSNNSDTVFKASAMINDGYPSLKWEKIASFVESTVDGLDILEIPGGSKFFGQDFYDISIVEGDRVTDDMGFAFVDDTSYYSNVNYIIEHDDITDVAETSNRGMMAVPKNSMARANESQFNALKASATSVTFKGASYKVTDFVDGYYIASTCEDINSALYWIKKDSVSDNALVSPAVSGIDYGSFFTVGINGTLTGVASNAVDTGVAFPLPTGGETKFAYQFTFAYPDNGGMYADGEGFTLWIDGMNFRIGTDGVYREDATFGTRVLDFGTNGTSAENLNKNSMVPSETIDIEHYFLATDAYSAKIGTLETMYQDNYWHNVMVLIDTESKYFTIYIDGLPVYFKAENGGYSCRYRLANDTVEEVTLITSVSNVYNDHAPIFDNFLGYATFSSDAAIEESILQNLTLPYIDDIGFVIEGDFMLDENESNNVSWSFDSDALVIDEENPLLVRYNAPFGWGESTVKLTATSKYGTATKTRTFNLTVKDRQKYTVNTVLMKDSAGNRIYRPLDNSVIESVSYTANVKEDAKMYLAVYEADGQLASCVTKPVADGVVTFNQPINANQTYKVFIWAANELKLLAELKEDDYIESENPTIFSIGDSLAQTYGEGAKLQGWGERLHTIFEDNVTVDNTRSYGGRTCKWVHEEDSIKYILEKGKPGDYVFFMFGHNEDKDDYRSSDLEVYSLFHKQIINAAKAKGMIPVVVTPVARPWLDGGVARDSHGEYPETAMAAAEACGTPYIDIDALTRADLERLGSAAISQYYNPGDTHTVLAGADWVVGLIADELAKMNLPISQYLK